VLERPVSEAVTAAPNPSVTGRRIVFTSLVIASFVGLIWLAAWALSAGGWDALDLLILVLFSMTLPWSVIGFWNATIGLLIMRFARDPIAAVLPAAARMRGDEPITASVAILLCIRNEIPDRVIRNLGPMLDDLAAAGVGSRFHVYVLSDTSDPAIAGAEELSFGIVAKRWSDRIAVTYRRRTDNVGFKAGNVRDFCERWGHLHELAVTLDADSFMPASAILRLVRIMQADAKIGILQGLVVGLPSTSAFARIFQFGMRLGMRSYTIGSAWWQADCGPYWGHNALLRLAPFMAHCDLQSVADGGQQILSHDQIEAVLMRAAGFEVRVLPEEDLGWEENPPTLIEFIRRDLRWCQGNMQYWRLLFLPGIRPVSRYQLAFAILMFLGSPAWMALLVIGTLKAAATPNLADFIRPDAGLALFCVTLFMWASPKLATFIDVLLRPKERWSFGGTARFVASFACETTYSFLLTPLMWCGHTLFLARLPFRRTVGWAAQMRDDHAVPLGLACRALWPYTLIGVGAIALLAVTHPAAIPYALPLAAGPALSIPLAVITARPAVGAALARIGIGRLPEETAAPVAVAALALPAIAAARPASA